MPMAQLPALPNGKVNRKGLPPPDFTHVARRKYVGPHNLNEEHIQEIWQEVRSFAQKSDGAAWQCGAPLPGYGQRQAICR